MTTEPALIEAQIIEGEGGGAVLIADLPAAEVPALEAEADAIETVADSAVQIATIEAAARVEIAETQAAVEITRIEADAEANAEVIAMRERITWLEAETMNTQERNRELLAEVERLTPPALPVEEVAEIVAALDPETLTTDTSETMPETSSETGMGAPSESGGGAPVAEAEAAVVHAKRRVTRLL